jgi:hypothetical protein
MTFRQKKFFCLKSILFLEAIEMEEKQNWKVPQSAIIFVCFQGILVAVIAVTRSNLTWLVAQTQTTMSLRVVLQMISGVLAISLAPFAAALAKRFGGAGLVALLALLVVPLSIQMSLAAADGSVLIGHIMTYGIAIAFIQAFSSPAHEEFLSRLVGRHPDAINNKALVIRLRNIIQFFGRIGIWVGLAIGAVTVVGVAAAQSTYLLEAVFMSCFAFIVFIFLRKKGIPAAKSNYKEDSPALENTKREPWQWNHPLLGVFALEFSLNCFFLGALMLPKLLPDKSLSTLYYVMAAGALGSILGTLITRMTKLSLWGFVVLDILMLLFTYSMNSTFAIGVGWFLANLCYGATDTIFARAVQSGTSDRTANLASLRRVLMAGLLNFTLFGIVKAQEYLAFSERQICYISLLLTSTLVGLCWLKRDWINRAFEEAVNN